MSSTSHPIRIDADEMYPVYSVRSAPYGLEVEATSEQVERWEAAAAAFRASQDEMGELYDSAHAAEIARQAQEQAERDAAARAEQERLRQHRRRAAEERQARQDAMWERINASGGVVYDAQGQRIGEVHAAQSGARLEP